MLVVCFMRYSVLPVCVCVFVQCVSVCTHLPHPHSGSDQGYKLLNSAVVNRLLWPSHVADGDTLESHVPGDYGCPQSVSSVILPQIDSG